jgi:Flp pilus assembly protein TadG
MSGASVFRKFRAAAGRFIGARDGNVAVIFGLSAIPIISFMGAAVDYTRASAARSSMQAALDSTALMLSKDLTAGAIDPSQISTKAAEYFGALYNNKDAQNVTITPTYTPQSGSTPAKVKLDGTGSIVTDFMRVAGFPNMNFGTSSTTTWGNTRMRVAMVLDNTGSMAQNGKLGAMQSAAKDMIDQLSKYNKQTGDVFISIVPFTKDVNVGTNNVNASWINWTEWEAQPPILDNDSTWKASTAKAGSSCPFSKSSYGFVCMDRPATLSGAKTTTTIPSTGTYAGYICPGLDNGNKLPGKTSIYYNGCYTTVTGSSASCGTNTQCSCAGSGSSKVCHLWRGDGTAATAAAAPEHDTWTGCVNDRDQDYDATNVAPGSGSGTPSTQFYAEQWSQCLAAEVFPMSNDWTTLKAQIDAMTAAGNTNQSIGMAWGWQSLSTTNGPIAAPAKSNSYINKDYIVLLSDGLNTQNRWSTSETSIDTRQELLCKNIKLDTANPVTVFTIQVNINNADPKSQVLQDCAVNGGNFQMITSTGETSTAFKNIITEISKLRVAR